MATYLMLKLYFYFSDPDDDSDTDPEVKSIYCNGLARTKEG